MYIYIYIYIQSVSKYNMQDILVLGITYMYIYIYLYIYRYEQIYISVRCYLYIYYMICNMFNIMYMYLYCIHISTYTRYGQGKSSSLSGNHEPLRQERALGRTILALARRIISTPSNCYFWTTTSRLNVPAVLWVLFRTREWWFINIEHPILEVFDVDLALNMMLPLLVGFCTITYWISLDIFLDCYVF